jgi:ribonuclease T2
MLSDVHRIGHGTKTMKALAGQAASRWMLLALTLLAMGVCTMAMARHHRAAQDGETGQFDYYLVSLSWSPSYCLTHAYDQAQCGGKGFGFVLHGLWPQYDSGGYPQNCATEALLTPEAQALAATLYPSPKLIEHEWSRHGTCSGLDAVAYFRTADRAAAAVKIPPMFEAPRANLMMRPEEIVAAFQAANSSLPADAIRVACSRGELSEVRVCLTRTLAIRPCGRGVRSSCPADAVQLPASR